jgi:hypothetical protein
MNKKCPGLLSLLAVVGLVFVSACAWTTQVGELQHDSRTIELGGAESVAVEVKMGAGELTIAGGAESLVDAGFIYNVADWRPTIDYVVSGERGELWIEQPEAKNFRLDSYHNEWDLALNEEVPIELHVVLGAGEGEIDVSQLSLADLDLDMGVGDVDLDLTGDRGHDLDVTIRGGVGEATVLLPADVGVQAQVSGGLGTIETNGMTGQDGVYVNAAYGASDATITLSIEAGVGEIELRVVD